MSDPGAMGIEPGSARLLRELQSNIPEPKEAEEPWDGFLEAPVVAARAAEIVQQIVQGGGGFDIRAWAGEYLPAIPGAGFDAVRWLVGATSGGDGQIWWTCAGLDRWYAGMFQSACSPWPEGVSPL